MLRRDTQCRGVFVHDGCVSIYVTHGKSQNACGIFCWHLQIDRCQTVECCGLARQRKASVYTAQRGRLLYCIRLRRTHPRPIVKPPTSRSIIVLNAVTRMSHVEGQRRSVVHQLFSFLCIAKLSVVRLSSHRPFRLCRRDIGKCIELVFLWTYSSCSLLCLVSFFP